MRNRQELSAPERAGGLNPRRLLGNLVAFVVLTFVLWYRLPATTRGTVWAEDGGVFLRDVLAHGALQSIPLPYDGYLHIVPRTLASIAYMVVPLEGFALGMSLLSCCVVAGTAIAVFHLSQSLIQPVALRLMLAAIPVLLPVGPQEVLGNAANLHWYLLWLAPWLVLHKPQTGLGKGMIFVAALATAASEIVTGLFVPLAIWSLVRRRNIWGPLGLLLGVGLQVLATLSKPRFESMPTGAGVDLLSVFYGFFLLPIGSLWHADGRTLASNVVNFGPGALFLPTALVLGLLIYTLVTGRMALKVAAVAAFAAAVAAWSASVIVSGNPIFNYANFSKADWQTGFGYLRYAAAPAMFLLALVPLAAAAAAERFKIRAKLPLLGVAVAFIVFLLPAYLPADTTRETGPLWSPGISAAREACNADAQLQSAAAIVAPAAWKFAQVQISCDVLRSR